MSRTQCKLENCPDKDKYGTLIYSITCKDCFSKKMTLMNGDDCRCTFIEVCDECLLGEEEEDVCYCICSEDYINPECEWCF
jgi:hypothetical protein